jgi:2-polyprenyl-3-methyl-5-hydroxy-6-metoxy-1,4-benzoquinol methylase
MQLTRNLKSSAEETWPADDLEFLARCPACEGTTRQILLPAVDDLMFGVARGDWQIWRCGSCSCSYIDPRPTEDSNKRAYLDYYTHTAADTDVSTRYLTHRSIGARLRRGHYNLKFGHSFGDAWSAGRVLARLSPQREAHWDHFIRHLPAPSVKGEPLLDIGCGAGAFLPVAKALGYSAVGLEPDPNAVTAARTAGDDVRQGTIPGSGLPSSFFAQVTLHHVFEHLRNPPEAAREILNILKPGGRLWLSQPNLEATSRSVFGAHWRTWDAPRHLTLYGAECLVNLLGQWGFVNAKVLPPKPDAMLYYKQSLQMREGVLPTYPPTPSSWNAAWETQARQQDRMAMKRPEIAENVTVIAFKPG